MKNQRGQRGSIRVESGSWIGYWNTYQYNPDTDENVRKQRSIKLGPRSLSKHQAYKKLAKHIEQSTEQIQRPDSAITLETFTRTRWLPLREATWRPSTRASAEHVLGHVLGKFGKVPLERLDTIAIQNWLNGLAATHSDSVVKHCRIYIKSILDEAVDQDYLRKNMAKKVTLPLTRQVEKAILTQEQINAVFAELDEKHGLLVDVCSACALRPSELFALRWRDFDPVAGVFHIRESVYRGNLRPYTKTTKAGSQEVHLLTVVIPDLLVKDLVKYRGKVTNGQGSRPWTGDDHFIFSSERGTFMLKENFLNRVLYPVRDKLKLPVLNFQVLRRSIATESQQDGSVKDVQSQMRHRSPDMAAEEYMQPIDASRRKMVNAVYDRQRAKRKAS